MKYYKFTADTPYCGTENTTYMKFKTQPTESELADIAADLNASNAESYEYMVFGWEADPVADGEMTEEEYEEEMESYREDCTCFYDEVSEEEYFENGGE